MSEKKAKEARKQEADAKKPVGCVVIDVYEGGGVGVRGFPEDHTAAMAIMLNAIMQVSHYFTQPLPEKSSILLASPAASPIDILQMARGGK